MDVQKNALQRSKERDVAGVTELENERGREIEDRQTEREREREREKERQRDRLQEEDNP